MTPSILVAEPDREQGSVIADMLRADGHVARFARNWTEARRALHEEVPDLFLFDCHLPDCSAIDALEYLAHDEKFAAMRIVSTSADQDRDALNVFRAGADEFLSKPYSLDELQIRLSICLRKPALSQSRLRLVEAGHIQIDTQSHQVSIGARALTLAPLEYKLLRFFVTNPDRLFSRKELLNRVWAASGCLGERTVDVHIRRLRTRLEKYGCERYVQTVHGAGYRFSVPNYVLYPRNSV